MQFDLFIRLETLDFLIRTHTTGTPKKLASRLSMSERNLYHFLGVMRDLGAPIGYCRIRQTYYYTENGAFSMRFKKTDQIHLPTELPDDSQIELSA